MSRSLSLSEKIFVFTTSPVLIKWRTMNRLRRHPHLSPCLRPSRNSVSQSNSTDPRYCCRNVTPGWHRRNYSRRNSRYRTLVSRTIDLSKAITIFKNYESILQRLPIHTKHFLIVSYHNEHKKKAPNYL